MSSARDLPFNSGDAEQPAAPRSRFAYHTETEPVEGGVRAVDPAGTKPTKQPPRTAGSNGIAAPSGTTGAPGPADRLLDVSELARSVGMRYVHDFDIPPHEADFVEYAAPLVGQVTLTNTGAVLLLDGHVQTILNLECSRCLATTAQPVEADIEEQFDLVATRNAFHQEEVQAVDDDPPASVITGNILDLGELLRQNVLLAAPSKPLCEDECAGLPNPAGENIFPSDEESDDAEPVEAVADSPLKRLAELLAQRGEQGDK